MAEESEILWSCGIGSKRLGIVMLGLEKHPSSFPLGSRMRAEPLVEGEGGINTPAHSETSPRAETW